ncbi:acetamidase/formamidase family protein [Caldibacillus sp. 210928-DFI.2.22]|uniref:acetamidase/formamidase family protein n=1 Tax=unclassified Caldibacillus TaxID=2641266 RepID=UPI001D0613F8|nr:MULTISPECIES: acetamidase/formamidase family protein [unclassified Caldibacillus]MCB7071541.1 acetamidase/formamidase family protein [Caldibacillus sp. 210928-DFI.2.22]MCB7074974.1 acetamidase/formamidase family protein [Caldibacillus sp. 210928-DFI.2.18]
MRYQLSKETYIYAMSSENKPVLHVPSGSQVEIETYDCFLNQIESEDTGYGSIDWDHVNPATGPIYVEDAEPGDILKVEIKKIELADEGTMVTGPNLGVMGHKLSDFSIKKVPVKDGIIRFNEKLEFPITPMIGVIGVAPAEGKINCGTPGEHGGNMDTKLITEKATLYFPVFHDGALFSLGDVHAAMGDGEVCVSGVEIPAKVSATLSVIKGQSIPTPFLENEDGFTVIVSRQTIDDAASVAVETMVQYLVDRTDMETDEVTMLLSAIGEVQISQIVDPLKTARVFVPKSVLKSYQVDKLF